MADDTVITTLCHLVQIDIDAIGAYTQAISNCPGTELARTLSAFRDDHGHHVRELSDAIRRLGGEPPGQRHLSGLAIEGFTAAATLAGRAGVLAAMQSNEVVTNDAYREALSRDLPGEVRALVERNYRDEQRHLTTVRAQLEETVPAGPILSQAATIQGWSTAAWMNTLAATFPPR